MGEIMKLFILPLMALATACSITQKIEPVAQPLSALCVEKNNDILMDDYLSIIEKNLSELNVPSKSVAPHEEKDCQNILRYHANWQWDIAMYLVYADFRVSHGDIQIGYAEYSSEWGDFRPDKFGTTEGLVKPILKSLFRNQN
jgi:hypothetical protein